MQKKTKNKKFLVTAGPTHEYIDPVRFIGNQSSGKMGFAIAEELADKNAEVILITGPTHLETKNKSIKKINITSADEMLTNVLEHFSSVDCIIMSAAVADYTPVKTFDKKHKKENSNLQINLKPTSDILKELGKLKKEKQILVGFALETDNEIQNAKNKLKRKNLDFIVLNSLNDAGAGFQYDTNKITIIDKYNKITNFELKSKTEVAKDIVEKIFDLI